MITISDAIREATELAGKAQKPVRTVTDEQLASMLVILGTRGYRPSEQIIEPLRAYMQGYSILLSGDAGLGKTFLMRCLGESICTAESIAAYGLLHVRSWYEWTDEKDVCIDDLGAEHIVSEYGTKDDVLKAVIAHRDSQQTRNHRMSDMTAPRVGRTHITTNLTSAQIAARYGDRTLSRIMGMCKAFRLEGKDMRNAQA